MVLVPDSEDGYEPPSPPKWKKRDVFNPADVRELDEKARKVTITNSTTFEELASELTSGLKTDLQKVRALFMWMGHQDIEGRTYSWFTNPEDHTPEGFMKLMKDKKRSYPKFFAHLCRKAGIPCVVMRGNCKSKDYEVGDKKTGNGKWNIVFVDGSWQIIHPLWAFTAVKGFQTDGLIKIESDGEGARDRQAAKEGVQIRHIDEACFLPHPEEFIYTCIAEKKEWQLLEEPWDLETFCSVPQFEYEYFTSDYKLTSPHRAVFASKNGKCELEFTEKKGASSELTYQLFFDEKRSDEKLPLELQLPRTVFFETEGNKLRLVLRFHVVGTYKLTIISDGYKLAQFRLQAKEKSENQNMVPVAPAIGFGFGKTATGEGLRNPSHTRGVVPTQPNKVVIFTFRIIKITEVVVEMRHIRKGSTELEKYVDRTVKGHDVTIKVTMPGDAKEEEYVIQIFLEKINVLNYILTCRETDFETNPKKLLRLTSVGDDPDKLEKAIKDFEDDDLDEDGDLPAARERLQKLRKMDRLKQHLKNAVKGEDPNLLKKAIEGFEENGIPDNDGYRSLAKKKLEELLKRVRLKLQLKNAIKGDDSDQLKKAIEEFEETGIKDVDGDLPVAKKRLQELLKKKRLKLKITNAMKGDDPEQLKKAIEDFEEAGIPDEDGDLPLAKKTLQKLLTINRLKLQLKNAMKGVDPKEVKKAIEEFEEAGITDEDRDLPVAKKRLQQLFEIENLKIKLRLALKGNNPDQLLAVIRECEEAGIPDDDADLTEAKRKLQDMSRNRLRDDEAEKQRGNLIRATGKRLLEDVERAIIQCEEIGLHGDDDLIRGRQLLVQLYEEGLTNAMSANNVNEVKRLEKKANASPVAQEVSDSAVMLKEKTFIRIQKYHSVILDVKPSTVSEIHRCTKPHPAIFQAVVATYIILGQDMNSLQEWNSVRTLLRLAGPRGLIRRIKTFSFDDLDETTALEAKMRLDKYTLDDVRLVSAGAAAFHAWSSNIVTEHLSSL